MRDSGQAASSLKPTPSASRTELGRLYRKDRTMRGKIGDGGGHSGRSEQRLNAPRPLSVPCAPGSARVGCRCDPVAKAIELSWGRAVGEGRKQTLSASAAQLDFADAPAWHSTAPRACRR